MAPAGSTSADGVVEPVPLNRLVPSTLSVLSSARLTVPMTETLLPSTSTFVSVASESEPFTDRLISSPVAATLTSLEPGACTLATKAETLLVVNFTEASLMLSLLRAWMVMTLSLTENWLESIWTPPETSTPSSVSSPNASTS